MWELLKREETNGNSTKRGSPKEKCRDARSFNKQTACGDSPMKGVWGGGLLKKEGCHRFGERKSSFGRKNNIIGHFDRIRAESIWGTRA